MEIEGILKEIARLRSRQEYLRRMLSRELSKEEKKHILLIASQNKWIMDKIDMWVGKLNG